MAVNKVVINRDGVEETLIDLTEDTIFPSQVSDEVTMFHCKDGALYSGNMRRLLGLNYVVPESNLYDEDDDTLVIGLYARNLEYLYAGITGESASETETFDKTSDEFYNTYYVGPGADSNFISTLDIQKSYFGEATADQVLSGNTFTSTAGLKVEGTMTNNTSTSTVLNDTTTSYTIPTGYHDGSGKVSHSTVSIPNPTISVSSAGLITASNTWTKGYTTNASYSNTKQLTTQGAKTYTPTTSNQTIASGTYLTGIQTIQGDSNLVSSNIISGVSIFGVSGNVTFSTVYTGPSEPSSTLGSDGDIFMLVG